MEKKFKKINVLHLVLSLEIGGLERLIVAIAENTNKSLYNVEVCCLDAEGQFAEYLKGRGYKVLYIRRNQKHFDYLLPFKIKQILINRKIDILHMHTGTFHHGMYGALLTLRPTGTIFTEHGRHIPDPKLNIYADRLLSPFVGKIVAVSNDLKKYLIDVVKITSHKVTLILNGVDQDIFKKRPINKELLRSFSLSEKNRIVGTVGRLAEVKDHYNLIKAFKIINEKIPESRLLIVGDGPLKNNLEHFIKKSETTDNTIILLGSRNDIPELLNLFDVFALSSISEGTSVSLLEAMSSQLPVVVTNVGGNKEIVDDNINGYLVPVSNHEKLADKITNVLENPEKARDLALNAFEKVKSEYSLTAMIAQYEKLYMQILDCKPRR